MTQHAKIVLSDSAAIALTPIGTHSGMDITIQNIDSSAYVYIGGEGVSASNFGYRISPNHAISFELPGRDDLYAISDTNESEIAVIKTNLESGN